MDMSHTLQWTQFTQDELKEMRRQHFRGFVMIEYEDNPESNVQQIKESLQYFYKTAATLK